MPEGDLLPDPEQALGLTAGCSIHRNAELLGRAPQQQWITNRIGCGEQKKKPRISRKAFQSPREALLDSS
jgi:hypothetical protein